MHEGIRTSLVAVLAIVCVATCLAGCQGQTNLGDGNTNSSAAGSSQENAQDADGKIDGSGGSSNASSNDTENANANDASGSDSDSAEANQTINTPAALAEALGLTYDLRGEFCHGEKGSEYQKYIVIHDTEVDSTPEGIIDAWDSQGKGIAAHFVIGKDGSVVQCVPMDKIAHHAGFGDAGHNEQFGVEDESRDDKVGTTAIGSSYPDYGMNSYSVGIELVHVGSTGEDYPVEQLQALDRLVAYIDACYGGPGKGGTIIDHKMWRTTNSDTSAEFAGYLSSYRERRTHE